MNKIIIILGIIVGIAHGLKVGLLFMGAAFFFFVFVSLVTEMRMMRKYKHEYIACTDAVLANDAKMADEVNRWTTHYYVHKTFRMSSNKGKIGCGYYLEVRDRPRDPLGGVGGGDIGFISFGV